MDRLQPSPAAGRISPLPVVFAVLLIAGWALSPSTARAGDCPQVFVMVDEQPTVVGGLAALQSAVRYPASAYRDGVEGRVFVQFVVGPGGQIETAAVTRGVHPELDAEALRVIRGARVLPGKQDGQAVCVQMSLPITFRLDGPSLQQQEAPVSNAVTDAAAQGAGAVDGVVNEATTQVTRAADTVSETATAVSASVDETATATSTAITTTTESLVDAKETVKGTFRGLFGRNKESEPDEETVIEAAPAMEGGGVTAGDVLTVKIDNVTLHAEPAATATVIAPVMTTDAVVYLGETTNGYLYVQTAAGAGWINELLVTK